MNSLYWADSVSAERIRSLATRHRFVVAVWLGTDRLMATGPRPDLILGCDHIPSNHEFEEFCLAQDAPAGMGKVVNRRCEYVCLLHAHRFGMTKRLQNAS